MRTRTDATDRYRTATLTIEEVAARLGIARTAFALAKRNALPVPVIRLGRRLVVSRELVDRLLAGESMTISASDRSRGRDAVPWCEPAPRYHLENIPHEMKEQLRWIVFRMVRLLTRVGSRWSRYGRLSDVEVLLRPARDRLPLTLRLPRATTTTSYGTAERGFLPIWTSQSKQAHWYPPVTQLDAAAIASCQLADDGLDGRTLGRPVEVVVVARGSRRVSEQIRSRAGPRHYSSLSLHSATEATAHPCQKATIGTRSNGVVPSFRAECFLGGSGVPVPTPRDSISPLGIV